MDRAVEGVATPEDHSSYVLKPSDGGILGAVITIVGAIFWARRKWSSDTKAVEADKGEVKLIDRLSEKLTEADKALTLAYTERNALSIEVGGLRAKVQYLEAEDSRNKSRIAALERKLGLNFDTTPGKL